MSTQNQLGRFTNGELQNLVNIPNTLLADYRDRKQRFEPSWNRYRDGMQLPDVIEARIIQFISAHPHGIRICINRLADNLAEHLGTPRPLSDLRFLNDAEQLHHAMVADPFEMDYQRLEDIAKRIIRNSREEPVRWLIGSDVTARYLPAQIVVDPNFHDNLPVLDSTSHTAEEIADHARLHGDVRAAAHFAITPPQAQACREFQQQLVSARRLRRSHRDYHHLVDVAEAISDNEKLLGGILDNVRRYNQETLPDMITDPQPEPTTHYVSESTMQVHTPEGRYVRCTTLPFETPMACGHNPATYSDAWQRVNSMKAQPALPETICTACLEDYCDQLARSPSP